MPTALHFTSDPAACELLAEDPFALLVGFAIDQQVPVPKAFAGPQVLKDRAGTLDPKKLAAMDLNPIFAEKPAIHRFPGAMAERVRELAAVVAEDYGGDASRIWSEAEDGRDLHRELPRHDVLGELLPAEGRRHRRSGLRPHRIDGCDRLPPPVLPVVDEDARPLLLQPFGRHLAGMPLLEAPREPLRELVRV